MARINTEGSNVREWRQLKSSPTSGGAYSLASGNQSGGGSTNTGKGIGNFMKKVGKFLTTPMSDKIYKEFAEPYLDRKQEEGINIYGPGDENLRHLRGTGTNQEQSSLKGTAFEDQGKKLEEPIKESKIALKWEGTPIGLSEKLSHHYGYNVKGATDAAYQNTMKAFSTYKQASDYASSYLGGKTAGTQDEYREAMRRYGLSDAASVKYNTALEAEGRASTAYNEKFHKDITNQGYQWTDYGWKMKQPDKFALPQETQIAESYLSDTAVRALVESGQIPSTMSPKQIQMMLDKPGRTSDYDQMLLKRMKV